MMSFTCLQSVLHNSTRSFKRLQRFPLEQQKLFTTAFFSCLSQRGFSSAFSPLFTRADPLNNRSLFANSLLTCSTQLGHRGPFSPTNFFLLNSSSSRCFSNESAGATRSLTSSAPLNSEASARSPATSQEVQALVTQLQRVLKAEEERRELERQLRAQLGEIHAQLAPVEAKKIELDARAERHANRIMWGSLLFMSLQFGLLARLTWWEYSWDITEPITAFVNYGTLIFFYAYYLVTRMEPQYSATEKRHQVLYLYKRGKEGHSLIERYNSLREQKSTIERELATLPAFSLLDPALMPPHLAKAAPASTQGASTDAKPNHAHGHEAPKAATH